MARGDRFRSHGVIGAYFFGGPRIGTVTPQRLALRDASPGAFLTATILMLIALVARALIAREDPGFPQFLFLFPAVALAGWFCGPAAGGVAIVIGAASADFLWPSVHPNAVLLPHVDAFADAVFAAVAVLLLWITVALRRALTDVEVTRAMLDQALGKDAIGAWAIDLTTQTVRGSRGTHEVHRLPSGGRASHVDDWVATIDPDDAIRVRRMLADAAQTRRPVSIEYRVPGRPGAAAGSAFDRHILLRAIVPSDGRRRLVGALIDVSGRARAETLVRAHERQLRESEAKFRALTEALPGLLYVTDGAGQNTFTNRYFLDFAGVEVDDLRGDGWARIVHPDDLQGAVEGWAGAVASGQPYRAEYRLRSRDGLYRWFLFHAVPVRDADDLVIQWYGVAIEIEDRKRAEAALADNEQRLRLAIEAGCLGTFEVDLATRRRYWDPRLAAIFGLAAEPSEIEAARIPDFAHPDDLRRIEDHFEDAVTTGRLGELEFRIVTPSGEVRWVASSGLVLHGQDGSRRMIGAMRDITEQRRREDALREALDAREMLVREADHRIKNSLQLVVGLLTLQRSRLSDPEAAEALESAAARVEAVAQSHLALQQSEDFKTFDLGRALRELCARLGHLTPGVELRCGFDGGCVLDAERAIPLALIVSELLTNAMRHAYPDGGGAVTVDLAAADGRVAVAVGDHGVGYAHADSKPGLGSTVVSTLARQIGAEVTVHSAPGAGTSTTVTLPL